jgi:hypothetical protein
MSGLDWILLMIVAMLSAGVFLLAGLGATALIFLKVSSRIAAVDRDARDPNS